MRNIKIMMEYDGGNYHGFQKQLELPTIQGELEHALEKLTGEKIAVIGAGRTDAGVHATGQGANFVTHSRIPVAAIPEALNSHLPRDIMVKEAKEVSLDFHAREWAKSREYVYRICNGKYFPLFARKYTYGIPKVLDLDLMSKGALCLIGEQDFSSFCIAHSGTQTYVRQLYSIDITGKPIKEYFGLDGDNSNSELISLTFKANGFLHRMVRGIVGVLIEVGLGKLEPEKVREILEAKDRRAAGSSVPPQGLCLTKVEY